MARRTNTKTDPPPTPAQTPHSRARRKAATKKATPTNGHSSPDNVRALVVDAANPRMHPEQRDMLEHLPHAPPPALLPQAIHTLEGDAAIRVPAPAGPSRIPANGESIDEVTSALFIAALEGVEAVAELAARLPPNAVRDVVLNVLPEQWRNASAVELLSKLTDGDAGLLLAWLVRQWWDAYALGQDHARTGEDLRGAREEIPAL